MLSRRIDSKCFSPTSLLLNCCLLLNICWAIQEPEALSKLSLRMRSEPFRSTILPDQCYSMPQSFLKAARLEGERLNSSMSCVYAKFNDRPLLASSRVFLIIFLELAVRSDVSPFSPFLLLTYSLRTWLETTSILFDARASYVNNPYRCASSILHSCDSVEGSSDSAVSLFSSVLPPVYRSSQQQLEEQSLKQDRHSFSQSLLLSPSNAKSSIEKYYSANKLAGVVIQAGGPSRPAVKSAMCRFKFIFFSCEIQFYSARSFLKSHQSSCSLITSLLIFTALGSTDHSAPSFFVFFLAPSFTSSSSFIYKKFLIPWSAEHCPPYTSTRHPSETAECLDILPQCRSRWGFVCTWLHLQSRRSSSQTSASGYSSTPIPPISTRDIFLWMMLRE